MGSGNGDLIRTYFEAFGGGVDDVARYWHPDIDWRAMAGAPDDVGVIRGHEALRAYYQDWIDTFDDLRGEVDEILFDEGDRVAAVVRNSGRGRSSGVATRGRYYVVCIVRDGQITSGREYGTREEALEAVRAA
ncbi:MAG: nuclear transport factor 2 family protein [Thermoleophilaceae bacterium]